MALRTGMRRGELLNTTWRNIDFCRKSVDVAPKEDTEYTWEWHIKDTDQRTLPLTDDLVELLVEQQAKQPDGYPYVLVPPFRYDHIQKRRKKGRWTEEDGRYLVNNFTPRFNVVRAMAGIDNGKFHDFRCTCLSNWIAQELSEFEVMTIAGHSKFETTRAFYLAVRDDLLDRAKAASQASFDENFVAHLLRAPLEGQESKRPTSVNACQPLT